jgi:hypothetical protein
MARSSTLPMLFPKDHAVKSVCTVKKIEASADVKQVQAVVAMSGMHLEEVEAGEHLEWKDPADRSPSYKIYYA